MSKLVSRRHNSLVDVERIAVLVFQVAIADFYRIGPPFDADYRCRCLRGTEVLAESLGIDRCGRDNQSQLRAPLQQALVTRFEVERAEQEFKFDFKR